MMSVFSHLVIKTRGKLIVTIRLYWLILQGLVLSVLLFPPNQAHTHTFHAFLHRVALTGPFVRVLLRVACDIITM